MSVFPMDQFPVLTTPRLVLRRFTHGDAPEIFAMKSDLEAIKYDSDPPMPDLAAALAEIDEMNGCFNEKKGIWWGIELKESRRLIGDLVFFFHGQQFYKADLGYGVARPYWQQGIATEAARAAITFAFETLRVHRVNVDTRIDNPGSVGLMRTLGFTHEGTRRECIRNEDGTYQSWALYGLLEAEYRQRF